jgi:hypothetical protein
MNSTQPQPNRFTYQLEIRGVITEILFNSPDGWLETNIKYGRSAQYGGVIRTLSLPVKFVHLGASLVRQEFYKYAQLARVNLRIFRNNPLTFEDEQFFFGKLDFSKWSDEPTGVTVNLIENNINTQIAAYGDQQYQIPLTVNPTQRTAWINSRGYDPMVDLLLTPLLLEETADLIFNTSPDFRMNAFFQTSIADYQQMSITPSVQGTGFLWDGNPITFANNPNYFFVAQTDGLMRISSPLDPITGLPVVGAIQTSVNGKPGGVNAQYQFNIYNQTGALVKTLAQTGLVNGTVEFTFQFDFSTHVTKGDKLFFYIKNILDDTYGNSDTNHGVNMQAGSMRLTFNTITPATHCQALRPEYVFDYLVQQMNGTDNPTVTTQSRLLGLNGLLYQACITCSNAIQTSQAATIYQAGDSLQYGNEYRVYGGIVHYVNSDGFATDFAPGSIFKAIYPHDTFTTDPDQDGFVQQQNNNPQLLISYNMLFKAIRGLMGAQLGTGLDPTNLDAAGQPKYCMEDLRYFYRSTAKGATSNQAALDLSNQIDVKSPRLEAAEDLLINGIKGGYSNPQLTALNSGKEFNAGVIYGTKITTTSNVLDITSPINASCYAIEEKRTQPGYLQPSSGLTGTFYLNSAASRSDNDLHFVYVRPAAEIGGWYQPLTVSDGCLSFSGVSGEVYNWPLSPMQNLLRGSNYLASVFDKMQGYTIYLTGADKNTSMITVDLNGRRVAESDVVNVSDLGAQIFIPYYDNITTGMQFNAEQMLSVNPFGEVWFMYRGINWKAFINTVSVDCGSNSPQGIKVLLTPGNDLGMRVF